MLNQSSVDEVFRALAEPTRRAILERLGSGPATVSDLAQPFNVTMAAVVQHLQVLELCGLVRTDKFGRIRTCHIEPGGFAPALEWIEARRTRVEHNLDRLGAVLDEMDPPTPPTRGKAKS